MVRQLSLFLRGLTHTELLQIAHPPKSLHSAELCVRPKKSGKCWCRKDSTSCEAAVLADNVQGREDIKLTLALRFSGWNLLIDLRLRLQHFHIHSYPLDGYVRIFPETTAQPARSHVALDAYTEHSLFLLQGGRGVGLGSAGRTYW